MEQLQRRLLEAEEETARANAARRRLEEATQAPAPPRRVWGDPLLKPQKDLEGNKTETVTAHFAFYTLCIKINCVPFCVFELIMRFQQRPAWKYVSHPLQYQVINRLGGSELCYQLLLLHAPFSLLLIINCVIYYQNGELHSAKAVFVLFNPSIMDEKRTIWSHLSCK